MKPTFFQIGEKAILASESLGPIGRPSCGFGLYPQYKSECHPG